MVIYCGETLEPCSVFVQGSYFMQCNETFRDYRSGYCGLAFHTGATCTLQLPSKFSVAIICPVALYNHRSLFHE
jgi:hypothetical protein